MNKIDTYISDKLYERESYYLTLKRLRDATNSTIRVIDYSNPDIASGKVLMFQLLTGRDELSQNARLNGEKLNPFIKEKGFEYTAKMYVAEQKYLQSIRENNVKAQKKCAKKLKRCYNKSCKKLDKQYSRLMAVYGGQLQYLVYKDDEYSYIESILDDLRNRLDELHSDVETFQTDLAYLDEVINPYHQEIKEILYGVIDQLSNIDGDLLDREIILNNLKSRLDKINSHVESFRSNLKNLDDSISPNQQEFQKFLHQIIDQLSNIESILNNTNDGDSNNSDT